jgi:hypothetical protein
MIFRSQTANETWMIFWVVTPCISERPRRFGGTYRLHFQIPQLSIYSYFCWFLPWVTFLCWRWRRYFLPKRRSFSNLQPRKATAVNTSTAALPHTRMFQMYKVRWFVLLEASPCSGSAHAWCPAPYTLISSEIFRSQQRIREQYLQHALQVVPKYMWHAAEKACKSEHRVKFKWQRTSPGDRRQ